MLRSSAAAPSRVRGLVALLSLSALVVLAASAGAAPPGKWTQIAHAHSGAHANLGLARGKDGTLHVLWAGPAGRAFTAVYDTRISPSGALAAPQTVVSGWSALNPPAAVTTADGAIHGIVSGQRHAVINDPNSGLNEVVGPGSWALEAKAFGKFPITDASNSDPSVAVLKSGELVNVWASAAAILMQTGVSPTTVPQNITPQGDPASSPVVAVDQASGDAVMAYYGVQSGKTFFRRILPSLDAPQAMPQSKNQGPSLAARAGGGVYSAYTPDGKKAWLLRFGGQPKAVPVPKGAIVETASVFAGPQGRLWVAYGNEKTTYVTRSNKAVTRYEPVQALPSPPGAVQYFHLEGEGSAGPLDLFADVTIDGTLHDGTYQRHLLPALSLSASRHAAKKGTLVTVRVSDAGDPVAGAKVAGLPGGAKTTGANGTVSVTTDAHGTFRLTGSKAGYVSAKGGVTL